MGCYKFLRGTMIFFNLLIFLGGLTLLAAGIWVKVDGSSFNNILGPAVNVHFANVGYFCIAVGLLLIVIGFIGCVGAYKESKCLLITFFIIVLIILIAQIAAAVAALVYADVAEDIVKAEASQHLKEEYGRKSNPKGKIITEVWDLFMSKFKCCGYNGTSDFTAYQVANNVTTLPDVCCATKPCNSTNAYQPCGDKLVTFFRENAKIVGGIVAGICAIEILAMIIALVVACNSQDEMKA
uniref:tetraspanin-1-like n=1 Tax=Myxine glutinosa TaxID=7769 RepID=UPI00358EF0FF